MKVHQKEKAAPFPPVFGLPTRFFEEVARETFQVFEKPGEKHFASKEEGVKIGTSAAEKGGTTQKGVQIRISLFYALNSSRHNFYVLWLVLCAL
jgi:hypothetical protein